MRLDYSYNIIKRGKNKKGVPKQGKYETSRQYFRATGFIADTYFDKKTKRIKNRNIIK